MSESIDLIDLALGVAGGEAVTVNVFENDLSIRRNFTGDEVHEYLKLHREGESAPTLKEQLQNIVGSLSDSADDAQAAFIDAVMELTIPEINRVVVKIGQIAGLRDEQGNFLPGAPVS
ncbi:hypothetical protein [Corynebacterium sp. H113]|uniref:hypothetical protein n=1 Tax=Corynebacterium sp. H113 TaxID=3133419 RepID=UPI0030B1D435